MNAIDRIVAASEIERVIAGVTGVVEVAVVARKDRMLDEVPVAFLRTTLGPVHERRALADELPRSTLEKTAKAQLRAQLAREPQAGVRTAG
jgi:crotonobetaine/carnitine-CoA ligase